MKRNSIWIIGLLCISLIIPLAYVSATVSPYLDTAPTTSIITEPTSSEIIEPTETLPPSSSTTVPTEPAVVLPTFNCQWENFEYIKFSNLEDLQMEREKLEKYSIQFTLACSQYIIELPLANSSPEAAEAWEFYETVLRPEQNRLTELIERYRWDHRMLEYPVATQVWLFLTNEMGYSEFVAAGIIGNMMAECGGQTLKLDWTAVNKKSGCYGLCQWHPKYHKEVQGGNLAAQLNYMKTSIPKGMSQQWALNAYRKGFTYEEFLALQDPAEAAYAFCVIYERPGPGSYEKRRENALKAYEYFAL